MITKQGSHHVGRLPPAFIELSPVDVSDSETRIPSDAVSPDKCHALHVTHSQ